MTLAIMHVTLAIILVTLMHVTLAIMHVTITHIISYSIILAVIAYFVIGAVIMAKVKGARGMEIIPNIAFWKDLPFLIKVTDYTRHTLHVILLFSSSQDGIMFVLSPCVGHRSSYTKM